MCVTFDLCVFSVQELGKHLQVVVATLVEIAQQSEDEGGPINQVMV